MRPVGFVFFSVGPAFQRAKRDLDQNRSKQLLMITFQKTSVGSPLVNVKLTGTLKFPRSVLCSATALNRVAARQKPDLDKSNPRF